MVSGEPPTGPSTAKVAGYGLIGVGVIAAAIGVSTVNAEEDPQAAQKVPPAPSSAHEPGIDPGSQQPGTDRGDARPGHDQGSAQPGNDRPGGGSDPGTPGPQVPPQSEPGGSVADPPAPNRTPQQDESDQQGQVVVRVYNNSKIKGLADRAARDFRAAGYEVPEIGNFARGVIPTTTVYFRPGTGEEAAAEEAAEHFGARAEPRFEGVGDASPGLIAIITNDYRGASS